jgi:hypothetical protein
VRRRRRPRYLGVVQPYLGDRPGWRRPLHRLALVGRHEPVPVIVVDGPPFTSCRDCWWVGIELAAYAEVLGETLPASLADEWVWLPRRVWQRALQDAW